MERKNSKSTLIWILIIIILKRSSQFVDTIPHVRLQLEFSFANMQIQTVSLSLAKSNRKHNTYDETLLIPSLTPPVTPRLCPHTSSLTQSSDLWIFSFCNNVIVNLLYFPEIRLMVLSPSVTDLVPVRKESALLWIIQRHCRKADLFLTIWMCNLFY